MSRGPGRRQRALLDALERPGVDGVVVTEADETHAEQVANRRAAYTLEKAGRIQLVVQRFDDGNRLVAYRSDFELPETGFSHGIDGKLYRRPIG